MENFVRNSKLNIEKEIKRIEQQPIAPLERIKQDLEEAADPYEFLDKNYSISGILDNLDKLSPRELKCACCLFGVALQKACKKKRRW